MIDLHIHSNYSDGSETVVSILKEAEKRKLEVISITDHDTVKAYRELDKINVENYYKGEIIPGCEFKCLYKEYKLPIEILGYGFNVKEIDNKIDENMNRNIQNRYLSTLKEVGKSIGLHFSESLKIDYKDESYASAVFSKEINKYPENKKILEDNNIQIKENFYREAQNNPNSIFYIDETYDYLSADVIIELIHQTGGLAFLAHPFEYPIDNILKALEEFINNYKIDGIECYYSLFTEQQILQIEQLCEKYNLLLSGGTDFHGKSKPNISLGIGRGNLNITRDKMSNWEWKLTEK